MSEEQKQPLGRIVMIHGVKADNTSRLHLRRLVPAFSREGFCVVTPKYGFIPAFVIGMFKWVDTRIAESMSAFIGPDDILLGYSNGATLAYLISQKQPVKGCILLNAALDDKLLPNAEFIHVYFNEGDVVAFLSSLFPFHPWGAMGRRGYKGKWDPRVSNIDQGNPPLETLPKLDGHSDIFNIKKTLPWSRYMAKLAAQSVTSINSRRKQS